MKKLTFTLLLTLLSGLIMAQVCTPGFISDPGGNGEIAPLEFENVFTCAPSYEAVVTVIVPTDTTVAPFINCNINTLTLDGIVGLPAGFTYACNPASCIFPGGDTVCVSLVGTPSLAVPGDYPISISTTTNLTCPILGTFDEVGTTESGISIGVFDCPDCAALEAPVGLKSIANYGTGKMEFSWSPVTGAAGYRVTGGKLPGGLGGSLPVNIGEFNTNASVGFSALLDGASYHWAVTAGCGPGGAPFSALSAEDTFVHSNTPRLADQHENYFAETGAVDIYPNPASDNLIVEMNSETDQHINIRIYDQIGRLMRTQESEFFTGMNIIRYDLSEWESGMYLLELSTENGKTVKKFTISR